VLNHGEIRQITQARHEQEEYPVARARRHHEANWQPMVKIELENLSRRTRAQHRQIAREQVKRKPKPMGQNRILERSMCF
jgi:hypothetical protein